MPPRIVSLLSSATEILFALGLGEQIVGVGHECDWPPAALSRPRLTRSLIPASADSATIDEEVKARMSAGLPLYEVDAERIQQLAPDLIVTQAQCDVCAVKYDDVVSLVANAQALRHTQVLALQPTCLNEILNDVLRIGEAAEARSAAQHFHAQLQQRVNAVRKQTQCLSTAERLRVACIEWLEPLMLAGNWTPELISLAGGYSLLAPSGEHSQYTAWDDVVRCDPQVVIVAPCGFDFKRCLREAQSLIDWPHWRELSAVKHGRVYVVDGNAYLNRSGPRIVDSLEILAHLFLPEVFARPACPGWERIEAAIKTTP